VIAAGGVSFPVERVDKERMAEVGKLVVSSARRAPQAINPGE
jgi:hypothetical protein